MWSPIVDPHNLHWEWVDGARQQSSGGSLSIVCCNNPQPSTLRPICIETSPIFPGRNIRNKLCGMGQRTRLRSRDSYPMISLNHFQNKAVILLQCMKTWGQERGSSKWQVEYEWSPGQFFDQTVLLRLRPIPNFLFSKFRFLFFYFQRNLKTRTRTGQNQNLTQRKKKNIITARLLVVEPPLTKPCNCSHFPHGRSELYTFNFIYYILYKSGKVIPERHHLAVWSLMWPKISPPHFPTNVWSRSQCGIVFSWQLLGAPSISGIFKVKLSMPRRYNIQEKKEGIFDYVVYPPTPQLTVTYFWFFESTLALICVPSKGVSRARQSCLFQICFTLDSWRCVELCIKFSQIGVDLRFYTVAFASRNLS